MSAPVFVDTNVLVYVRDATEPDKQRRAAEWLAALWDARAGRVSTQVLQEYYVTLTRNLTPPRDRDEAREDVGSLRAWSPQPVDEHVMNLAWDVEDRFGYSWWDALIIAAASRAGCGFLLSEDLQDGQELLGLRIISPFTHEPAAILGAPEFSPYRPPPGQGAP